MVHDAAASLGHTGHNQDQLVCRWLFLEISGSEPNARGIFPEVSSHHSLPYLFRSAGKLGLQPLWSAQAWNLILCSLLLQLVFQVHLRLLSFHWHLMWTLRKAVLA